jgi:hypothetical protein
LKGLSKLIFKYEKPVIKKRIIPKLILLQKFDYLIPGILAIFIDLMNKDDLILKSEFTETIWPSIKALTVSKEIPA